MVDRRYLGSYTTSFLLLALILVPGCGGGGKSKPEDLSSVETADSTTDDAEVDTATELTETASTEDRPAEAEEVEYADVSAPSPEAEPSPTEETEQAEIASEPEVDESTTQEPEDTEGDGSSVNDSVTVIESGEDADSTANLSLVEAAAAERARRREAPPTNIVITDKNLSTYAIGQLTDIQKGEDTTSSDANAAALEEARAEEEYWSSRALAIRTGWAEAAERADELEAEVFHLRQRFYAEDDGFYRDSQIKPAWDRAIEQLQETNREIDERQEELAAFLAEGREAGALPGWLREGVDLEPAPRKDEESVYVEPDRNEYQPGEPVVVEETGNEPDQ